LSELEEIRVGTCENSRMHKEITKLFHDRHIHIKEFFPGQKVLLYDIRLHPFPGRLRSCWTDPFIIFDVFSHCAIVIQDLTRGMHFKVNGQRLKPFLEPSAKEREVECLMLY